MWNEDRHQVDDVVVPATEDQTLPLPKWGMWSAIGLTLFAIVATLVGGFVAAAVLTLDMNSDLSSAIMGLALCLPYVAVIGLLSLVTRRKGLPLAQGVGLRPVSVWRIAPFALVVAFGARLLTGLWGLLLQAFGVDLPGSRIDPTALLPPGVVGIVFTVLAACVLAPIAEEMVFRGVLLSALTERWGERVGIVVSAAAFAAVHIYPFAMVPIFALALVLARLFLRSRTLWLPVAVHMLFNTLGVVALYALRLAGRL